MPVLKILIAILIFGLLILIHEFGHFIAARLCKVKVIEFSLGMGPRIFTWNTRETAFSLKLIPFGGSCRMKSTVTENETDNCTDKGDCSDCFEEKTPFQRFCIVAAGPLFNFFLAFIAAIILVANIGTDEPSISDVINGFPAQEQGLQSGDRIESINGSNIKVYREIQLYLTMYPDRDLDLLVKRNNELIRYNVRPEYDRESGRLLIGIISSNKPVMPTDFFDTVKYAYYEVRFAVKEAIDSLIYIFNGRAQLQEISGPVGIISNIGDTVEESSAYGVKMMILTVMNIIILFSANLGIINLLPIPALDGGRLLFIVIEGALGRPLNKKIENSLTVFFFLLLMAFMVFIVISDIGKIF